MTIERTEPPNVCLRIKVSEENNQLAKRGIESSKMDATVQIEKCKL